MMMMMMMMMMQEIFRRIKRLTLARLMWEQEEKEESVYQLGQDDSTSVVTVDTVDENAQLFRATDDFLLLDVRSHKEFKVNCIRGAINFPAIMLRQDNFIRDVYAYRNKENKVIVVYDAEDAENGDGASFTTKLIQKGFANIVLLTGGFKYFAFRFPELVDGHVPEPPKAQTRPPISMSRRGSRAGSANSQRKNKKFSPPSTPQRTSMLQRLYGSPESRAESIRSTISTVAAVSRYARGEDNIDMESSSASVAASVQSNRRKRVPKSSAMSSTASSIMAAAAATSTSPVAAAATMSKTGRKFYAAHGNGGPTHHLKQQRLQQQRKRLEERRMSDYSTTSSAAYGSHQVSSSSSLSTSSSTAASSKKAHVVPRSSSSTSLHRYH
eukprot:TRINITY_DN58245_c0_g1_i1.p1 TRINITY_DN58245_c0_g1~~TRINITY_DN58245_c0_g1_i1.p1  ORF type:complete len:383 (+),score=175.53 TRINITY_DN58245_c0_g1_i1:269-1417(+)